MSDIEFYASNPNLNVRLLKPVLVERPTSHQVQPA